jgi:hypothetical protein
VGTFYKTLHIIYGYSAKLPERRPSLLLDTTADRALALDANIADLNRITLPEFPCMEDPRQSVGSEIFVNFTVLIKLVENFLKNYGSKNGGM